MGVIQKTFAVGALLVATTGAWAVTATASLSNIQFQVFDLNPLDGIAPSFTILSGSRYSTAYTGSGLSDWNPVTASSSINAPGLALAASALGNEFDPSSLTLTSSLSDTALSTYGNSGAYGTASFNVLIGAGTLLLVTADASVAANGVGSLEQTSVSASTLLEFSESIDGTSAYSNSGRQAYTGFSYFIKMPSSTGQISASFINNAGSSKEIYFQASAQTYVGTPLATPVPEPTTSAMLLSGLGVALGIAFRRRERRA